MWGGAIVQGTDAQATSSAVNSLQTPAFSSTVTTGNTILFVVFGEIQTTATTVYVSDTEGNSYTCDILNAYNSGSSNVISNPGSNNVPAGVTWASVWRASNVTGGSGFKLTVTLGGTVTGFFAMCACEVSGLASASAVDTSATNAGASGSPSSGSFTTAYPSDFLLTAICGAGGSSTPTFTLPSGYSAFSGVESATSTNVDGQAAYQIVGAVQSSVNPTWTVTNFTDWVAVAVAYKAKFIVQETTQASGNGVNSVQTSAFGSAVTTGNTVLVFVMGDSFSAAATLSVSDTESNSYTCDLLDVYNSGNDVIASPTTTNVPATGTNCFISVWRASNVTGGSSFKTTVTLGGSATGKLYMAAAEFTGLANTSPVDTSTSNATAGTDPTTGSFSTSNANDLIIIAFCGTGSPILVTSITTPAGYTVLPLSNSAESNPCGQACYQIVSSTLSSVNPGWTTAHITDNVAIALAYEQATGGGPATPTGLAVVNDATNPTTALDVSWNSSSGATSYNLLQAATVGGTYTQIATGITGTSYVVGSLTQGTEYAFEVEAVNGSGTSAASSGVAWATEPSAPTGLAVTGPTTKSVTQLTAECNIYSPNSNILLGVNPYIYRYEQPPGAGNWQTTTGGINCQIYALSPGTQYGVEVAVAIQSSNGDWSGTIQGPWSSEADGITYPIPKAVMKSQAVMTATW